MNTDAIAERYASDGYYIANRLVGDEECDKLKAEALALMRTHARVGASVFVGAAVVSAAFRRLADDSRIVEILRTIMRAASHS